MNAVDRLRVVAEYGAWTRRVGHTTLMLEGVRRCLDQRPVVLVAHDQQRQLMQSEHHGAGITYITIDEVERLRAMQRPLWIDHEALRTLVADAVAEMQTIVLTARAEEAERQATRWHKEGERWRLEVAEARRVLNTLGTDETIADAIRRIFRGVKGVEG